MFVLRCLDVSLLTHTIHQTDSCCSIHLVTNTHKHTHTHTHTHLLSTKYAWSARIAPAVSLSYKSVAVVTTVAVCLLRPFTSNVQTFSDLRRLTLRFCLSGDGVWLYASVCSCTLVCVIVCFCMLLYAVVCFCMLLFAAVCFCMLLYAAVCFCMLLYAAVYFFMLLYATVWFCMLLYASVCCMLLYPSVCCCMQLYATVWCCMLLCGSICHSVLLFATVFCCELWQCISNCSCCMLLPIRASSTRILRWWNWPFIAKVSLKINCTEVTYLSRESLPVPYYLFPLRPAVYNEQFPRNSRTGGFTRRNISKQWACPAHDVHWTIQRFTSFRDKIFS